LEGVDLVNRIRMVEYQAKDLFSQQFAEVDWKEILYSSNRLCNYHSDHFFSHLEFPVSSGGTVAFSAGIWVSFSSQGNL
jgi:hypothetical protein